jgi:hypothetical protein
VHDVGVVQDEQARGAAHVALREVLLHEEIDGGRVHGRCADWTKNLRLRHARIRAPKNRQRYQRFVDWIRAARDAGRGAPSKR